MGKSDDSISRRRNKKIHRKQENKKDPSSKVSARVATIIAAKKRRQTGKRSMCQGMCFTLPSPDDPFNDRQGKTEPTRKRKRDTKANKKFKDKNSHRLKKFIDLKNLKNVKSALASSIGFMGSEIVIDLGKHRSVNNTERPSKYLIMCLNSIQNATQSGESDNPLFADAWGLEFWNCYCTGKDVLETNGSDSTLQQIAWVASTAADSISKKEKEGVSFGGPFLLYLVPSQHRAYEVRQICKPLKEHGIHTVSLHSGASIDHQIKGLKSCEPEFLVSTPERILELISLKSIDISGVSLLVIDGVDDNLEGAQFAAVKSVRQFISGNLRTVVFM